MSPGHVKEPSGGHHRDLGAGKELCRPCVWFPEWGMVQCTAKPAGQNDGAHLVPEDPTLASCPREAGISVVGPPTQHNVGVKSEVDMSHRGMVGHS